MTDPYTTLGVKRDASADDIKKAYRSLAHKYHPDKKGGNEARFKEINEAYQVLSDPDKKSHFDRYGDAGGPQGFGGFGGSGGGFQDVRFDFGSMGGGFENIFDMFTGGFGQKAHGRPEKGEDLQLSVTVSRSDLGKTKVYEFEAFSACAACEGTGAKGRAFAECPECRGQGRVRQAVRTPLGTFAQVTACPRCEGAGRVPEAVCNTCRGAGRTKGRRTIEVHIPARFDDRYLIAFPAEGNAGLQGVPAGDLLITLRKA